jgi:hypothetical protein
MLVERVQLATVLLLTRRDMDSPPTVPRARTRMVLLPPPPLLLLLLLLEDDELLLPPSPTVMSELPLL